MNHAALATSSVQASVDYDVGLEAFVTRLLSHTPLSASDKTALRSLPAKLAEVRAHVDLTRLGQHTANATLVVEGLVGRFAQGRNGTRQVIATYLPGEAADLNNIVVPQSETALQMLSCGTVLRIPLSSLRAAAEQSPSLAKAFWRECTLESARIADTVINVSRRSAVARCAHMMCEMSWRLGLGVPNTDGFQFGVTQAALGGILGLTAVHLNRTLRSLAQSGIVFMKQGYVHVVDWSKMADAGQFDPAYLEFLKSSGHDAAPEQQILDISQTEETGRTSRFPNR